MNLKQCTKEELISIIKYLASGSCVSIERCLNEVKYQRLQKEQDECDKWLKISDESFSKYVELLKPYGGKVYKDIPTSVIEEATKYFRSYENASKKADKLLLK